MRLTIWTVYLCSWTNHDFLIDGLDKLLDNHCLHLEPTHVTIVYHYCEGLLEDLRIEELIEAVSSLLTFFKDHDECVHTIKTKFHELRLFMLHGKDDYKHNALESF